MAAAQFAVARSVNVLDAGSLLSAFGALGVAVVLLAETGPPAGFLPPGDSSLFTAVLLCAGGAARSLRRRASARRTRDGAAS